MINRAQCKALALRHSQESRNGKFTRVSAEFLDELSREVAQKIEQWVRTAPSVGKTLYSPKKGME